MRSFQPVAFAGWIARHFHDDFRALYRGMNEFCPIQIWRSHANTAHGTRFRIE